MIGRALSTEEVNVIMRISEMLTEQGVAADAAHCAAHSEIFAAMSEDFQALVILDMQFEVKL